MDKETRRSLLQLAYVSSMGIAMVVAVFGCFFVGRWLDERFQTGPYLSLLCLAIGIAAGFRNMYVLTKGCLKEEPGAGGDDDQEKRPPAEKD